MGLFDRFYNVNAIDEITEKFENEVTKTPLYKEEDMSKDAIYMVGMNEDGFTQLKVGYPTSVTLTLNAAGVAQLIKQLAVNIDEEYSVKVTRLEYNDE